MQMRPVRRQHERQGASPGLHKRHHQIILEVKNKDFWSWEVKTWKNPLRPTHPLAPAVVVILLC